MTHLASLVLTYMEKHHRGRARAIPRQRLLVEYVWLFEKMGDRAFRDFYSTQLPFCACDDGLFVPSEGEAGSAEVLEFERYLSPHMPPWKVRERIERIYRFYSKLRPEPEVEQGRLFG